MKKSIFFFIIALLSASQSNAEDRVVTLDLTKATTALEFNSENGSWNGTFNDDEEAIESQCFLFLHSSMSDYDTWWGFTASNSANNSQQKDVLSYQWSNMAAGGIELDENGEVKKDEFGMPVVNAAVPYLVAYYSAYMAARPVDMTFNDGKCYEPQGVYVNLNSYAYYSILCGDGFARAFTNGDKFTLTIHGVAADESERTVALELASYTNGDLTINRGWKYVDLTSLGAVNELYFTLDSTDSGTYGMNTPGYFCLDKLTVKPAEELSVNSVMGSGTSISYDRAGKIVNVEGADFAIIRNIAGQTVMSGEGNSFDISGLPAGVYIVRAGNESLKIAK